MMDLDTSSRTTRRDFISKVAGVGAMLALAPGIKLVELALAKAEGDAVTDLVRWGMLVDTSKCADGCDACVNACNEEHGIEDFGRPNTDPQWIRKVELKDKQTGKEYSLPLMCQHCENPPCVDVCPTGASFKRADGIVLVDKHICIGCRYCMMACPYKARSFVHENLSNQKSYSPRGKGTVESCTFCVHRVDDDRTPACVEACVAEGHQAIVFGDLNNPESEIAQRARTVSSRQIREDLNLNTGVRYEAI